MATTFYVHVEPAEHDIVWWAETPVVAGLSIAAPTLSDLRRLIDEAVSLHLGAAAAVELLLVTEEPETTNPSSELEPDRALPVNVGDSVRHALISVA